MPVKAKKINRIKKPAIEIPKLFPYRENGRNQTISKDKYSLKEEKQSGESVSSDVIKGFEFEVSNPK